MEKRILALEEQIKIIMQYLKDVDPVIANTSKDLQTLIGLLEKDRRVEYDPFSEGMKHFQD